MALAPFAASTLALEARALLTRLARVQPFALVMPMVGAARISPAAAIAIERHLMNGQRELRDRVRDYLRWLQAPEGRGSSPAEAQRRFAFLKLRFNAALTQFDIFADALTTRGEIGNGVWLGGLDAAAEEALAVDAVFEAPPVITYLDRGHGAAIRRARTRLPGGGENPVAIVRVPRERMVGSGIASSLVHEVGHQGAAVLDLLPSLRQELQARTARASNGERPAWELWTRWISEIVADFWSMARLGVAATQGLLGVVSLPRAFVFRISVGDPHPFPWIRVRLSSAAGSYLFPDPQWSLLDNLWESFYPRRGLDPAKLQILAALERTMPEFLRLLAQHRPPALRGRTLVNVFTIESRHPERLRRLFRDTGGRVSRMHSLAPTLAFAVLGQAKQDRKLSPEDESRTVAQLLTRWGLERALRGLGGSVATPRALVA